MNLMKADDYLEFAVKLAAGLFLGWIIFLGNDALVEFWSGFLDALVQSGMRGRVFPASFWYDFGTDQNAFQYIRRGIRFRGDPS